MSSVRRLLTVGHSYVVALNRRLAHELACAGRHQWEVTVAAPMFVHGDLRPIPLEKSPGEACKLVPVPVYLTRLAHVMFYGRTMRRLCAEPWDLIHCWEEPYVYAATQLARWTRPAPLVFYSFQNLSKRYPPPFNSFERYSMRRAAGWLAAGFRVERALETRIGYAGKPHQILPLGVDIKFYRPDPASGVAVRRSLGWVAGGPAVFGYLGRFIPEKGLRILMSALDAQQVSWRALFVGGGRLEVELRAWASKYSDGRVKIATGIPHHAVPGYLNAMDVLAAPSQTTRRWKEQFGRMLIEAMACGVPVIGSDSGEIPFVIADAGEIVPEADIAAWARALAVIAESPTRRAELGAAGRHRAESLYAWPIVARKHLDFFESLLGSPSG